MVLATNTVITYGSSTIHMRAFQPTVLRTVYKRCTTGTTSTVQHVNSGVAKQRHGNHYYKCQYNYYKKTLGLARLGQAWRPRNRKIHIALYYEVSRHMLLRKELLQQARLMINCNRIIIDYCCTRTVALDRRFYYFFTNHIIRVLLQKYRIQRCISCLLYTSPSPRDRQKSRMPSSA